MTKKHYEAIAGIMQKYKHPPLYEKDYSDYRTTEHIAHTLADYFQTDNPRFDRTRFLQACGIEQKRQCAHLLGTAIYKDRKLQGKQCHGCGQLITMQHQKSQT